MPIYEFICEKCGKEFEEIVSEGKIAPCPQCGAHDTHKVMSACARRTRCSSGEYGDYTATSSGGGCGGCSGGNCASCGR